MPSSVQYESPFKRHCEAATTTPVAGQVVGRIPEWLNGRLLRNGPGGKWVGKHEFKHLFDGFAQLHMININNGSATYSSRFLEGETYKKCMAAQRIVFNEFGSKSIPDPCMSAFGRFMVQFQPKKMDKEADNCSVHVMQVKDELIAMTETDNVCIVDPLTLETIGRYKYSDHCAVFRASAHPHVAPDGVAYNLAMSLVKNAPHYAVVALPQGDFTKAKVVASVPARWKLSPAYMHSFGITENYFIFEESPLALNVLKMMAPPILVPTLADSLVYNKNETTIFRIVSRATGEEVDTKYFADGFFGFHFTNCYEVDGCLVIDLVANNNDIISTLRMENLKANLEKPNKPSGSTPRRYVLPMRDIKKAKHGVNLVEGISDASISGGSYRSDATAILDDKNRVKLVPSLFADINMELPRINYTYNMKPYCYSYGVKFGQKNNPNSYGIVKLNMRTGETTTWKDDEYFTSEPVFVTDPDAKKEDDGVILSILLHKDEVNRCVLIILNAAEMAEIGRVNFTAQGAVSATFHGQFIADADATHGY